MTEFLVPARSISKSGLYNGSEYSEAGSLATVARAAELGVTMLDTADIYGFPGSENETWIGVFLLVPASPPCAYTWL